VTVRVVLADDQAVVRDGLALLLGAADDLDVVGAAADGTQAVSLVLAERPDVALVDLRMPGLDGAGVTAAVRAEAPEVRVLVLTTYADDDAVLPALRAGAAGYLTKDTTGEALVAAIRTVAAGGSVLDASVQRRRPRSPTASPPARSTCCASSPRACRTSRPRPGWWSARRR
jgi:DNA-binding NarL/FixJ family response regulator